MFKNIYKNNWKQKMMTCLLMWLNVSVTILNATLQFLVIYRYHLDATNHAKDFFFFFFYTLKI